MKYSHIYLRPALLRGECDVLLEFLSIQNYYFFFIFSKKAFAPSLRVKRGSRNFEQYGNETESYFKQRMPLTSALRCESLHFVRAVYIYIYIYIYIVCVCVCVFVCMCAYVCIYACIYFVRFSI